MRERGGENKNKNKERRRGQSLVEVVVGVGVGALVLGALMNAMITAHRAVEYAQNKSKAARYAQEALEWVRARRDLDGWVSFVDQATGTYCLNEELGLGVEFSSLPHNSCSDYSLEETFKREVQFFGGGDSVRAEARVSWQGRRGELAVVAETQLAKW